MILPAILFLAWVTVTVTVTASLAPSAGGRAHVNPLLLVFLVTARDVLRDLLSACAVPLPEATHVVRAALSQSPLSPPL